MSARQLNRLAKAKGLEHLLGGALNEESDASESTEDSEEEKPFSRGGVISASAFGDDSNESGSSSESESEEEDGIDNDSDSEKPEPTEANAVATAATSSNSSSGSGGSSGSSNASHLVAPTTASPASSPSDDPPGTSPPPPSSATPSNPQKGADPAKTPPSAAGGTVGASSKGGRTAERENDDQYLDNVISELASAAAAAAAAAEVAGETSQITGGVSSPLAQLLRCDPRCLKLDLELRRKFGAGAGGGGDRENGPGAGRGGRARRTRRGMMAMARGGNGPAPLALKRLVVSAPKEDWPKPPSLVGGGLGMKRCEAPAYLPPWQLRAHSGAEWFVFERSSSLEQLQRRFEAIQGMHDPNLLGGFASQAPYHADALLQLAMVFAHTGQMDRASEFVGRCLYVLESSSMEAFRPLEGACRLDPTLEVNKTYLAAMFRHMQMAGMVGGARTALEVGRLLLSVDPLGDPMGCLLALDSHALACREGKFVLELYDSKLPIGHSPSDLSRKASAGARPVEAAEPATLVTNGVIWPPIDSGPSVTVQDLPGLSMSACLAKLDSGAGVAAAREAMAETLLRFPVMLEPLLEKCGVSPRSTTYPQDWRSVMQHPHFAGARGRIPAGNVLLQLASIFAERGGEIWKHDRAMELLYDGAGIALQGLGTASMLDAKSTNDGVAESPGATAGVAATAAVATATTTPAAAAAAAAAAAVAVAEASSPGLRPSTPEAEVLRRCFGPGSPIHKYLELEISDFAEAFALLPQDANILNPRLMGPNFMNERVRLRMPAGARGGGLGGGGGGMLDGDFARAMRAFGGQEGGGVDWRGQRREAGRRAEGNLTPAAPLAQLFWQTLMPWNTFPTPSNPPPPPPRWL